MIYLPASEEEITSLKVGEVFYVTGIIVTARDAAHRRLLVEGVPLPINLTGLAIFHAGPVMVKPDSRWTCRSIGPTTSMRMEYYEYEFIERTGIRIVIGKGGMGIRTAEACRKFKAVYAIFPGGCGALGAEAVEEVLGVEWLDLGMPEALWILRVKELGPLIVSIDTNGSNLTETVKNNAKARVTQLLRTLRLDIN